MFSDVSGTPNIIAPNCSSFLTKIIRKDRHDCFHPFFNLFVRKAEKKKQVCTFRSYVVGLKKLVTKYGNISVKQARKSMEK
jgi:hypothetical protein